MVVLLSCFFGRGVGWIFVRELDLVGSPSGLDLDLATGVK